MVAKVPPKDFDLKIKFGGGLHTRASEDEIDPREAADGTNFLLDLENRELRNRPPFDLIGQVPNGAEIRGGGSLLASDGTVSTLIQAGGSVYEWDGGTGFALVGSVNASAKLRGHWRSHNWTLDDKLLLTDLSLVETVREWDGASFAATVFSNGATAFGTFYAKYVSIADERAVYSHVRDPSTVSPHMMVGSERSDYTTISVANRPSSSLGEADAFFLLTPDLKPINGHEEAFGTTVLSTEKGRLFHLSGSSAKDFSFDDFYPGSASSGEEAIAYVGNDIVYGRQGRIESVTDTQRFGDTESDDLTVNVSDQVEDYTGWKIVYNSRINRVYLFPSGISECWVFNNGATEEKLSRWMRWTTEHALAFQPTFVMSMLDPSDGLEYIIMGDASGNVYRMEGSGLEGDAGQNNIGVEWLTRLFSAPLDAEVYNVEGWIKYRKNVSATVTLTFRHAGVTAFDHPITVNIPAITGVAHFGGDYWFGGEVYFGALFENRLIRQKIDVPGQASDFQLHIAVDGVNDFNINEIGLRFKAASQ